MTFEEATAENRKDCVMIEVPFSKDSVYAKITNPTIRDFMIDHLGRALSYIPKEELSISQKDKLTLIKKMTDKYISELSILINKDYFTKSDFENKIMDSAEIYKDRVDELIKAGITKKPFVEPKMEIVEDEGSIGREKSNYEKEKK